MAIVTMKGDDLSDRAGHGCSWRRRVAREGANARQCQHDRGRRRCCDDACTRRVGWAIRKRRGNARQGTAVLASGSGEIKSKHISLRRTTGGGGERERDGGTHSLTKQIDVGWGVEGKGQANVGGKLKAATQLPPATIMTGKINSKHISLRITSGGGGERDRGTHHSLTAQNRRMGWGRGREGPGKGQAEGPGKGLVLWG